MFHEAPPNHILYPTFALVLLVVLVFLRLRSMRFAAVRRSAVSVTFYRTFQGDEEPDELRVVTRNFINLFEVPVLFYVVALMTYVTHHVTYWMVALAWLFVVLRYAHTIVHLTSNGVIARFSLYLASGLVLVAMWATLLAGLLTSG
jgi:hypothetical protein